MLVLSSFAALVLLSTQVLPTLAQAEPQEGTTIKMRIASRGMEHLLNEDGTLNAMRTKRAVELERRRRSHGAGKGQLSKGAYDRNGHHQTGGGPMRSSTHGGSAAKKTSQTPGQQSAEATLKTATSTWGLPVGLGTPPQNMLLYLDTSGTRTDIAAGGVPTSVHKFVYQPKKSITARVVSQSPRTQSSKYWGSWYEDTLTIGGLKVEGQQFLGITQTEHNVELEAVRNIPAFLRGTLGLGHNDSKDAIWTPMDHWIHNKVLKQNLFAVQLHDAGGHVSFGSYDQSHEMVWANVVHNAVSSGWTILGDAVVYRTNTRYKTKAGESKHEPEVQVFPTSKLGHKFRVEFSTWDQMSFIPMSMAARMFSGMKDFSYNEDLALYTVACSEIQKQQVGIVIKAKIFWVTLSSLNLGPIPGKSSICAFALTTEDSFRGILLASTFLRSLYVVFSHKPEGGRSLGIASAKTATTQAAKYAWPPLV